jgi:hypothetical protein
MLESDRSRWAGRNSAKAAKISKPPPRRIATELELIETRAPYPQPQGVAWAKVRPDQFADIPFMSALRRSIESP